MERSQLTARLRRIQQSLQTGLIERATPTRLALLAALAGEHTLLIGPPGTAKSELARRLHLAFEDGYYFERLLTRFSVPEELFGPLSIKALENDEYLRLTDNYLPAAAIAFIDEIFKANSAILNTLLTLLNEREFDNGGRRQKVPLISVIGASNELPQEEEVDALYDRFLCRYVVHPVSDEQFPALLELQEDQVAFIDTEDKLTASELKALQEAADGVTLPGEVIEQLIAARQFLQQKKFTISDRRWRKVIKLLKVSAYTNGRNEVCIWDCWLLQHCLWDEPEQHVVVSNWFNAHLGISSGFHPERLEKLVQTWESTLHADKESTVQAVDEGGYKLYISANGQLTRATEEKTHAYRDGQPLYLSPPDQDDRSHQGIGYTVDELRAQFFDDRYQQTHINGKWQHIDEYLADPENRFIRRYVNKPFMKPVQHTSTFIDSRLKEVCKAQKMIKKFEKALATYRDSVRDQVSEHLWIDQAFIEIAEKSLTQACHQAAALVSRLEAINSSYNQLIDQS